MAAKKKISKISFTLAKTSDGSVQITISIPFEIIAKQQKEVSQELAKDVVVAGFRKGKAPLAKALKKIPQNTLIEQTLNKLLPQAFAQALKKYNLKPAIYPKFELIKAKKDEAWQIKASTCELPQIELGDYKTYISALRAKKIWTPGEEKQTKEPSDEEKRAQIIKTLLDNIKTKIPQILLEREVNGRLANLLSRLEKLGLDLENYLTSIGKNVQSIRKEYETQANQAIGLELILAQIAEKENIKIDDKAVDQTIKEAVSANPQLKKQFSTPEQKEAIRSSLKRKAVFDFLLTLR